MLSNLMLYFIFQPSWKADRVGNGALRNESSLMRSVRNIPVLNLSPPAPCHPLSEAAHACSVKTCRRTRTRGYHFQLCLDIKISLVFYVHCIFINQCIHVSAITLEERSFKGFALQHGLPLTWLLSAQLT